MGLVFKRITAENLNTILTQSVGMTVSYKGLILQKSMHYETTISLHLFFQYGIDLASLNTNMKERDTENQHESFIFKKHTRNYKQNIKFPQSSTNFR